MKDEVAKPLIDALRGCVRKLMAIQIEHEGINGEAWPETLLAEQVIREVTRYEAFEAAMARFEAFAAQFDGMARTPDQMQVAESFKEFVNELNSSMFWQPDHERER
jgi:hypothetical protein